jgi:hypothetical protein
MLKNLFKKAALPVSFGSVALAAALPAHAAIDVSAVTAVIGDGVTAATTIGVAFLGLVGLIGVFRATRGAAR